MRRSRAAPLLGMALALSACAGGSETGNPVVTEIGLRTRSTDLQAWAVVSGVGGVIDEAWVAFGEFVFVRGDDCQLLGEYDVGGPTLLVADLAQPDVDLSVRVEPESYCGLVAPLQLQTPMLPDGAPAELFDNSVVVRGARADGTPFLLTYPEQDELELGADVGAFEVEPQGARLLLAFDVARWMNGVDLDGATPGPEGVIRISAATNPALLTAFEINLECSLELFSDDDDDGAVSAADRRLAHCLPE